jgi:uncharacterized protein
MARLLLWLILGFIAYVAAKRWASQSLRRPRAADPPSEAMVSCAACGLNVPKSEALAHDGRWYCSREHLERPRPER